MRIYKPFWLARVLPWVKYDLRVESNVIQIKKDSTSLLVDIEHLSQVPRVYSGWLLKSIVIDGQSYWGFSERDACRFVQSVRRQWYLFKFTPAQLFFQSCNTLFQSRYLRDSDFQVLISEAEKIRSQYGEPPEKGLLHKDKYNVFEFVERIIYSSDSLDEARAVFVQVELDRFSRLFDSVESNPLTLKQREACVIDNDNNLVLAGAGTGKTSTMVGKAGYLVESKRSKPEEILMLAFGNEAARELQERINLRLGNSEIKTSTFHALGKSIIASVENKSPSVSELAIDAKKCNKFIDDCLNDLLENSEYKKKVIRYFDRYLFPDENPFDFKSEGDYLDYLDSNEIRSLKGDEVKSYGELIIANYFYLNGIEYEYERPYEKKTFTSTFQQYRPDFYLTESGMYLEYYGVDRQGNTASYIDSRKYNEGIAWKRKLHDENGTVCLEAFH